AALPVAALKDHLRLGTGFADADLQDGLIEGYLRAAIAAVEGRIGKVLIARRFLMTLEGWRGDGTQALPLAPVTALVEVALVDAAGRRVVLPADCIRLVSDSQRPRLVARSGVLPGVPPGGRVEILFDAGFGAAWGAVPADLAQAVIWLATEFYETRHDAGEHRGGLPPGVQALIERWRTVRVLGGGAA
ncbi:MAG: hypothetical protein RIT14_162, partial [Pseudomonadota bacterium]